MTRKEKITCFLGVIALIVVGSSILAFFWDTLISFSHNYWFVSELYRTFYNIEESEEAVVCARKYPDMPFMVLWCFFFVPTLGILLRLGGDQDEDRGILSKKTVRQLLLAIIYSSSLFFCLFVFFINPKFGFITIALIFWPVLFWKMDKINIVLMIIGLMISASLGYVLVKSTAAVLLLLPTVHLLSIRTKNAISSRYVSKERRITTELSSTQKEKIKFNNKIKQLERLDWWNDIVEPELDELCGAFGVAITKPGSGIQSVDIDSEDSSDGKFDVVKAIKRSLITVQSISDLNQQINSIKVNDSNFSSDHFLDRFEKIFMAVTKALSNQDISSIQAMLSDSLYEQLKQKITEEKNSGIRYKSEDVTILYSNIIRAQNKQDFQEIHVWVNAKLTEIPIDLKTNEIMNKDVKPSVITEVYTFLRRPSAKTLQKPGLLECSCPNCGSPIEIGQVTVCKSCGGYIRSGSYDWVLSQITQACEWKYSNPCLVRGWYELSQLDKHVCIQQVEDKASVIFWMLKNMEQSRKPETIQRFATPAFYNEMRKSMILKSKEYVCYENISLASVKLQSIDVTDSAVNLYLLVVWSGISVEFNENGRIPSRHRYCKPVRNIVVLSRNLKATTKLDLALTGAHCPSCGGPLTSNYDIKCSYCGNILNDGSDWILANIMDEYDEKYIEYLENKNNIKSFSIEKMSEQAKNKVFTETKTTAESKPISNSVAEFKPIPEVIPASENKALLETKPVSETKADTESDSNSAVDIITIAVQLLMADGIISPSEINLLKKIGKMANVPNDKIVGIMKAAKDGTYSKIKYSEKTFKENKTLFEVAVAMAFADGILQPEEEKCVRELGHKIGYSDEEVDMYLKKGQLKYCKK